MIEDNLPIGTPDYYSSGNMEASDFIEVFGLNFNLGNVVKYIAQADRKPGENRFEALWKAYNYLIRELINTEKKEEKQEAIKAWNRRIDNAES